MCIRGVRPSLEGYIIKCVFVLLFFVFFLKESDFSVVLKIERMNSL